jgi:hypothetical protein
VVGDDDLGGIGGHALRALDLQVVFFLL